MRTLLWIGLFFLWWLIIVGWLSVILLGVGFVFAAGYGLLSLAASALGTGGLTALAIVGAALVLASPARKRPEPERLAPGTYPLRQFFRR